MHLPGITETQTASWLVIGRGWVYMREDGTVCPVGVFFPSFIVFFASKLAVFP